jgi:hypothetical protein
MERIECAAAMRRGIGHRIDDLHLFDDRAGPESLRDLYPTEARLQFRGAGILPRLSVQQ